MAGSERAIEGFFTAVIAPDATVFKHQQQPHLEKTSGINLEEMTEQELFSYICGTLLDAENKKYTSGNTGYHKLVHLAGGGENDIAACCDLKGNPICTNPPGHTKDHEIGEFKNAITDYDKFPIEERESKRGTFEELKVKVMSEIADLFHNLTMLTKLDNEKEKTYLECMNHLAFTLGYSVRDCLLLSASKYKKRLIDIGEKDTHEEEKVIRDIITPDANGKAILPFPENERLKAAGGVADEMGDVMVKGRISELNLMHEWNESARSQLYLQNT